MMFVIAMFGLPGVIIVSLAIMAYKRFVVDRTAVADHGPYQGPSTVTPRSGGRPVKSPLPSDVEAAYWKWRSSKTQSNAQDLVDAVGAWASRSGKGLQSAWSEVEIEHPTMWREIADMRSRLRPSTSQETSPGSPPNLPGLSSVDAATGDCETTQAEKPPRLADNRSRVDEIATAYRLLQDGAITQDEYTSIKAGLLGSEAV
jgi:hypothetical protein